MSGHRLLAPAAPDDPRTLAAVTLPEMAPIARERMHPDAWDYVSGGAADEITLADNEAAWRSARVVPRVLLNVAQVDPRVMFLGAEAAFPVAIAPMAAHALAHPDAEIATAGAAAGAGVPFILSTVSSRSIEEVAAAVPDGTRWFQLYPQADREVSRALVQRAAAAGYRALVVTVDLPVVGYRPRDLRNHFDLQVPLGNLDGREPSDAGLVGRIGSMRDATLPTLTWDSVDEIAGWSSLPVLLKGVLDPADARSAVEHGVAGLVVSNHGARQLDRTPTGLAALPAVLGAVDGRLPVWVDGGVRDGLDVAIACALGARGVLVGRPLLWGLAGAGQAGAARVLAILRDELERAMALLGAPTISSLVPSMVILPRP